MSPDTRVTISRASQLGLPKAHHLDCRHSQPDYPQVSVRLAKRQMIQPCGTCVPYRLDAP